VKLAIVVQRYGTTIAGGAELHARHVAEHLSRHAEVEVLTTCARDYVTWKNEFPRGRDECNGLPVLRFPVAHPRNVDRFGRLSGIVFDETHSAADELAWLEAEGPASPALVSHIRAKRDAYDFFLFWSFRYYQAYYGARAVPDRAILLPTAEREPAVGVSLFKPLLCGVRGLVYLTPEERDLVNGASGNEAVPSIVVGSGSEIPARVEPERFRQKHGIRGPFAIYVGRIDRNKGCDELFDDFVRYAKSRPDPMPLVLCGTSNLPIPDHPAVRHLGFVSEEEKFDAIAAAEVLIMPSYYESLSIVALEAWAVGTPVLANGRCDVLKGQCLRSNGGLFYDNWDEFAEGLSWFARRPELARALGRNGSAYFQSDYAWPVVEKRYLDLLGELQREARPAAEPPAAPGPGWWARRKPVLPPAARVLERLPKGPSRRP
jgi:glycosyltransferase involved in cell wall biosynthesis